MDKNKAIKDLVEMVVDRCYDYSRDICKFCGVDLEYSEIHKTSCEVTKAQAILAELEKEDFVYMVTAMEFEEAEHPWTRDVECFGNEVDAIEFLKKLNRNLMTIKQSQKYLFQKEIDAACKTARLLDSGLLQDTLPHYAYHELEVK